MDLKIVDGTEHAELIEPHHRFGEIKVGDASWDLAHLEAFAMRLDPNLGFLIDVVVMFSCHCFTTSIDSARQRAGDSQIHIYNDSREQRALCEERYRLSKQFLPMLVQGLANKTIRISADGGHNFFAVENVPNSAPETVYVLYLEVKKDRTRRRRVILRVQSAYPTKLTKRQRSARKVSFQVLLKRTYEGRAPFH